MNREVTPGDLRRNLAADLAYLDGAQETFDGLPLAVRQDMLFSQAALKGWPAAIRRALAAEAEVARLRAMVGNLTDRVASQSDQLGRNAERREQSE